MRPPSAISVIKRYRAILLKPRPRILICMRDYRGGGGGEYRTVVVGEGGTSMLGEGEDMGEEVWGGYKYVG